jgi:tRNA(Ser,Leu) C12 N-acetylase TAN1
MEWNWNVLATAFMRKERHLLRLLRAYGEFRGSGFRDVMVGKVEKVEAFLETLESIRREHPGRLRHLSQIVPIEKTFRFALSDFRERLKEAIASYAEQLENNCRFYVRVKRRGHKGEISSLEIEKEMSAFILDALEKAGKKAQVTFEDPDKVIIVETIGNRAGVGLITREMRERYLFIRVK